MAPYIYNFKMLQDEQTSKNQVVVYLTFEYTPQRIVSAAVYDDRRRVFEITSFTDNEHYTNLESLLIQANPQQAGDLFSVIVNMKTDIKIEIKKILEKLEDLKFAVDQSKVGSVNINFILQNLLSQDLVYYLKVTQDKKGMQALQRLLFQLKLDQDATNKKKFELNKFSFQNFMRLDQPAIISLQIFPQNMQKKVITGTSTMFQILNRCKTFFGTRCLKRWMRQPLQDVNLINQRLNKVALFLKYPIFRNSIHNQLKKLPDLDNLFYVFYKVDSGKKNNVEVNDLIKIYRTVQTMKDLLKVLTDKGANHMQLRETTEEIQKNIKILGTISSMIETNIIMQGRDRQFLVKPEAQKDLSVIAKQQSKINKQIQEHIRQVADYIGVEIDKLPSSNHKWVLEADKKKAIDKVKQNQNYRFISAKQNKITFTTETMVSLCKDIMILQTEYKQKQKQILTKMYKIVAGYYPVMQGMSKTLSQLDVFIAFAAMVGSSTNSDTPWCRPQFGSSIEGRSIHHPCVKSCIPNNCDISTHKTIILTGPNMGGKSTYIRTLGLAVYLAHIGCYVPAASFTTPIIDSVITRVGASDKQMKGISTFMSEMMESVALLKSATSRSLVLIDELGRGTSTSQGFGIAWAICMELHTKVKPFCLFATHFHEMTLMADQVEGVKNMYTSCQIKDNQLFLEYKVLQGKVGKSYGIEVAKMLNFPREIIEDAQKYQEIYETKTKQLIEQNNHEVISDKKKEAIALFMQMNLRISEDNKNEKTIKKQYKQKIKQVLSN